MSSRKKSKARKGKKSIPRFTSVKEECDFWDAHSFLDFGSWEIVPYDEVCEEMESRSGPKLPVTFRLDKDLIRKLKDAARSHGIKYQALAREILRRSLAGGPK